MTRPSLEGCRPLPPLAPPDAPPAAKPRTRPSRPTSDRFASVNMFVDVSLRTVSPVAGLVWIAMWREVRPPAGLATVSQRSLAERIGVSIDTVKRAVKELDGRGLIETVRRGNSMTGCSTYRVHARPGGA